MEKGKWIRTSEGYPIVNRKISDEGDFYYESETILIDGLWGNKRVIGSGHCVREGLDYLFDLDGYGCVDEVNAWMYIPDPLDIYVGEDLFSEFVCDGDINDKCNEQECDSCEKKEAFRKAFARTIHRWNEREKYES